MLSPRIKYPEIRLRVCTISNAPLPSSWILHGRIIRQFLSKILFTLPPIKKQVFRKKWGHYHSASIVHISSLVHLSHSCINYRKTSFTLLPGIKMLIIVFPLYFVEFLLKRFPFLRVRLQNPWMIMGNVCIKISPMQLID